MVDRYCILLLAASLSLVPSILAQNVCNEYCQDTSCSTENQCNTGCRSGAYLSPDRRQCRFCVVNCATCSSSGGCISCNTGFYRTAQGTACLEMPIDCYIVNATSRKCHQCNDEYGLDSQQRCKKCAANCAVCHIKGAGKCDRCKVGFTRKSDFSQCQACGSNCDACHISGPGNCDRCQRGYKRVDKKCLKRACKKGCLCDGDDSNRCDTSEDGYMLSRSPRTGDIVVLKCGAHCKSCGVPGSCSTCNPGYTLNSRTGGCVFSAATNLQSSLLPCLLMVLLALM